MSNDAAFNHDDVLAVYGERPHCVLTNLWNWTDLHHCLGRGYDLGYRGEDTKPFSSILNCAPIQRNIHAGPRRDNTLFRKFLLSVVRQIVFNAIGVGKYQLTENDQEFLKIADSWLQLHP